MKKTPTTSNHTSSRSAPNAPASTAASDLPIIRIMSEEEEMHVNLGLEMEDETHDMLVKWGKEVATDEDYVRIAIDAGIQEAVDALKDEQK
jgi:hypothetical protein